MSKFNYPKTKPMLIPIVNDSNDGIIFGGFQYRISREIYVEEPQDYLQFFKFLDGKNNIKSICEKYSLEKNECYEILESFLESGLIMENNSNNLGFQNEEVEIYSRNINFFAWIDNEGCYYNYWKVQKKLQTSKILLLGAGGTGSNCAINMARLGFGNITIVDFDVVDLNNINRQNFFYNDIGKKKIEVLKESINKINPFISLKIVDLKINELKDLMELDNDFDLLICCIDKPDNINEIIEEYTNKTKIPRILGGYASTIVSSGIFTKDSFSHMGIINNSSETNYIAKKIYENKFWKWDNSIISPVASIAGSMLCMLAMYYITGLSSLDLGTIHHMDLFNLHNKAFSYYINEKGLVKKEDLFD